MPGKRRVKTPLLLQMEAVECGAAALGIMLGHYGRFVPLAELRRECGVSRDGSRASNLVKAARRYGLRAKGYSKEAEALKTMDLPLIVFWKFNHFLVVEGFDGDRVFLNDPANGHVAVSWEEFDNSFTGVALAMEPGPEFRTGGSRTRVLPALLQRLRGNFLALIYCLLVGLFLVLPGLAAATFSQVFIDNILTETRFSWLRPLLVVMAATVLVQLFLKLMELYSLRRLRIALAVRMSSRFLWHLLQLPMSFYAQRFPGEISHRSSLNDKVAETLSGKLATTCIELSTMLFYVLAMFYYDVVLASIGLAFASLNFWALRRLSQRRVEANMRLAQQAGKTASLAVAALYSIEAIKASGRESEMFSRWAGHYAKSSNARGELEQSSLALGVLPTFLQTLTTVLILVIGGLRVIRGEISIGMLVAFQALMTSFLTPIANLVDLGRMLQELQADVTRLDDVLSNPTIPMTESNGNGELLTRISHPPHKPDAQARDGTELPSLARRACVAAVLATPRVGEKCGLSSRAVRLDGQLEITGVTFGYSPLAPPLIEDFSLHVRPGERVALIGASGSGKSTLAKLISGLYEPWNGSILFDGTRRDNLSTALLNNSLGMVDQEIMLFEGTVKENLTLWDQTVPNEVIERACKDAAIHDDITALPGGYDSVLPEGGASLSGGQRQRLEIARALITNPSLLILDEATSALDSETEHIINENLRLRGCTCVIVAHRLSTFRDCDEIVVLDRGKVVERGKHEDLWAARGHYSRLIQHEAQ